MIIPIILTLIVALSLFCLAMAGWYVNARERSQWERLYFDLRRAQEDQDEQPDEQSAV